MASQALWALSAGRAGAVPLAHFPARAKSVVFLYMSGGVSHVDSFDPKPRLQRDAGKPMPMEVKRTQFNQNGTIMPSPWDFRPRGQSGLEVSDLFPHIAAMADELAVVRSMTASFSEHAQGNFFMHTGFPFLGHPSAGAWVSYGLGSDAENLPGYVVLRSGGSVAPHGGQGLWDAGFLPSSHSASLFEVDREPPMAHIAPSLPPQLQRRALDFVRGADERFSAGLGKPDAVESAIANQEAAWRMQAAVPELCDIGGESRATRALYGLDDPDEKMAGYGRQCLTARRLVERGVRFVELTCLSHGIGGGNAPNPWDQHSQLIGGHGAMARQVDRPIAALLRDLKARGLLDTTLVVWAGEFGRTPFSQGADGRDHNPYGFSVWMAGGGVQGGVSYGATDEFGYHAVDRPCTVYDLWATVLHQMGVDHEALTYLHGGRNLRLTDVHGEVLGGIVKNE